MWALGRVCISASLHFAQCSRRRDAKKCQSKSMEKLDSDRKYGKKKYWI